MSKRALTPLGGQLDSAQNKLHLRKIGAAVNLRASEVGHSVLGVADFAEGAPRPPSQEGMTYAISPCAVNTFWPIGPSGGGV